MWGCLAAAAFRVAVVWAPRVGWAAVWPTESGLVWLLSGLGAAAVGALDVASSAPSRVRVPRVGALESPQPGLPSRVGRDKCTRDAAEKSWPEVRPFDAPLAGRARLPAKSFR